MDRYIQPLNNGGVPIIGEDVGGTEAELYNVLIAMIKGQMSTRSTAGTSFNEASTPGVRFTDNNVDGVVLSGCFATSPITYTHFAETATYSLSDGYVYLDDEICYFAGDIRNPVAADSAIFLIKDTSTFTSRKYQDNITRNVRVKTNAIITENLISSPPVGVPYVMLSSAIDGGAPYYNSQDISYAARLDLDIININNDINSISQEVNNPMTYTNLSITNPTDWSVYGGYTIQIGQYANGITNLRGGITHDTSTYSTTLTLPSQFRRNTHSGAGFKHMISKVSGADMTYLTITSAGLVLFPDITSGQNATFDIWYQV